MGTQKTQVSSPSIPTVAWFGEWASDLLAKAEAKFKETGNPIWFAVDIETPEKAEGTDEGDLDSGKTGFITLPDLGTVERPAALKDKKNIILRINFAYDENHGITVPFYGGYVDIVRTLLASPYLAKVFWNINYDRPRLVINECPVAEPAHDFMWAWHMLQSDLPRGLGFVSPFYSKWGPWKHLSDSEPGQYAAIDGLQTIRDTYGIKRDLEESGQWHWYMRHMYNLDRLALKPAEEVGLLVYPGEEPSESNPEGTGLHGFRHALQVEKERLTALINENVPVEIWPRKLYKTKRTITDKETGEYLPEHQGKIEEFLEVEFKLKCTGCDKVGVRKPHKPCVEKKGAVGEMVEVSVPRYNLILDFNPSSSDQLLKYIKHMGHKPGKNKKTKNASADAAALEALAKRHKTNPVYKNVLLLRDVDKMKGTYADGMLKRMDKDNRVHTTFQHKPSTLRLSSGDPNVQNMVKRGDEETAYAKKFRECIIASPGCVLIEADYSGIEAVEVGWFSGDPNYIRLATMGVHSYLCSHLLGKPADLSWSDEELAGYLKQFKHDKANADMYARSKRCVHGTNYGMTPAGMKANYPDTFPKIKDAEMVHALYMEVCPRLNEWQRNLIQRAHKMGYLGGDDHPFKYRHWFWNVINHKKLKKVDYERQKAKKMQVLENDAGYWSVQLGDDAKRAIAFYPQSTAGGVLKEALLNLFDPEIPETYIGDQFYGGKTPFRMPIHDSIFLEVPKIRVDYVLERLVKVMSAPVTNQPCPASWGIGQEDGLKIGVEVEMGTDWAKMEAVNL